MRLGVIVPLVDDVEKEIEKVRALGLPTCQLSGWQPRLFTAEMADRARNACRANGVEISAFWCGWEGPAAWNFVEGPLTLGLVPEAYRAERLAMLQRGAQFAAWLGAPDLVTHAGFIPEDLTDPRYPGVIEALRSLAGRCGELGLHFLFETGQETPVTLLRAMEDIGLDNLGINLDPANLLIYGKGNPVDALDVVGRYVRGVHAKDGLYPTSGRSLGVEVPLGQGRVDFPALFAGLKRLGYDGAVTIEREISGPEQLRDIRAGIRFLQPLLAGG